MSDGFWMAAGFVIICTIWIYTTTPPTRHP